MKVAELKEQINKLQAQISRLEATAINENIFLLEEEFLNYLDGVGQGYVESDHYAPSRYYSNIPGVKNFRCIKYHHDDEYTIDIKITSPSGKLFPDTINIRGEEYRIVFTESKNYSDRLDY